MRRSALVFCMLALALVFAGLGSVAAAAAGGKKLVEGTVFDTTCSAATCQPECPPPPHCGPITAQNGRIACPLRQRRIVACPLSATALPIYSGEGAVVKVRKRGSSTALATLPVTEGHFKIRLTPGEYVLHPYLPEESCWSGETAQLKVSAKDKGPVAAAIEVSDSCAAESRAASPR